MQKRLVAFFALAFMSHANAQEAASVDEITNRYLLETGQLRIELARARTEILALRHQVEDARKGAVKEPDKK